mgnify:CR=1 FL=1
MLLPVTEQAPAKLNLYLEITGKRPDGYHLLDSLVVFTAFSDTLHFYPADELSLEVEGDFAGMLKDEQGNIVLKAARALKEHTECRQGARIVLEKRIPVSAGLGGGSSDAAAALRGLSRLWDVHAAQDMWVPLARRLGSDVSVCLQMQPAIMRGAGEEVMPIACKVNAWAVMVNPGVPLSTAEVYQRFAGDFSKPGDGPATDSFDAVLANISQRRNALEASAIALCPAIVDTLKTLGGIQGCKLARMAGSGATCFGLFEQEKEAEAAADCLGKKYPWVVHTSLYRCQPK